MFVFNNVEVAKKFEAVEVDKDFKIRVPALGWPKSGDGFFSDITPDVAEQLIKEGYNRIRPKK